jgi:hypothetical protein
MKKAENTTYSNCNQNIIETYENPIPLTEIYMTTHFPGMDLLFMFEMEIRLN